MQPLNSFSSEGWTAAAVGSCLVPRPEYLRAFTSQLAAAAETAIGDRSAVGLAEAHNAYVTYVTALLLFTTGHRPVTDPLCYLRHLDVDARFCLAQDKAVTDRHEHRLLWLPAIACDQLRLYLKHVDGLARRLLAAGHESLAKVVATLLGPAESLQAVPLIFFLDPALTRTISVTVGLLEQRVTPMWGLPLNPGRDLIASIGGAAGLREELVSLALGHLTGLDHPLGAASPVSPAESGHAIRTQLDVLASGQGWRPIEGLSPRALPAVIVDRKVVRMHAGAHFGPEKRKAAREARHGDDSAVVRSALRERYPDFPGASPTVIDQDAAEGLRDRVLELSVGRPERAGRRVGLLWRLLARLKGRGHRVFLPGRIQLLSTEPFPFSEDFVTCYRRSVAAREVFSRYLDRRGKEGVDADGCTRLAEIILSAVLYGAMINAPRIEMLVDACRTPLRGVGGELVVELRDADASVKWRWLPDPVSAMLIRGLTIACTNAEVAAIPRKHVTQRVAELLHAIAADQLGLGRKLRASAGTFAALVQLADPFWAYHLPGLFREIARGTLPHEPLRDGGLRRLITGLPVLPRPGDQPGTGPNQTEPGSTAISEPEPPWIPAVSRTPEATRTALHHFQRDLDAIVREATEREAKANQRRSTGLNAFLASELKALLQARAGFAPVVAGVGAWIIHLCNQGTTNKKHLAFRTVCEYGRLAGRALFDRAATLRFLDLDAVEFEDLYLKALAGFKGRHLKKAGWVLEEFHGFLMEAWAVEEIDWQSLAAAARRESSRGRADANVISVADYRRAIELLAPGETLTGVPLDRLLQAALLVVGFNFGLRFGEALHLQRRDLLRSRDGKRFIVRVHPNVFGDRKTPAATRPVVLTRDLFDKENRILDFLVDRPSQSEGTDLQEALFCIEGKPRELIDRGVASYRVNEALRLTTGDPNVRYHHLRHTTAQRLALVLHYDRLAGPLFGQLRAALLEAADCGRLREAITAGDSVHERSYDAWATLLGHEDVGTTLSSYCHIADLMQGALVRRVAPPDLSHYGSAYASGRQYDAVRQAWLRSQADDTGGTATSGAQRVLHFQKLAAFALDERYLSGREFDRTAPPPETPGLHIPTPPRPSLVDVDRLLLTASNRHGNPARTVTSLLISEQVAREVLDVARELEGASGYRRFGLTPPPRGWVDDDATLGGSGRNLRTETIRLRRFLTGIDRSLQTELQDPASALRAALHRWVQRYHPRAPGLQLLFLSHEELTDLLPLLRLLDIAPDSLTALFPPPVAEGLDEKARQFLHETGIGRISVSRLPMPTGKTIARKTPRAALGWDPRKHDLAYPATLARAVFVIAVATTVFDRVRISRV